MPDKYKKFCKNNSFFVEWILDSACSEAFFGFTIVNFFYKALFVILNLVKHFHRASLKIKSRM